MLIDFGLGETAIYGAVCVHMRYVTYSHYLETASAQAPLDEPPCLPFSGLNRQQ